MTCGQRCPNKVNVSKVMDTLRHLSMEADLAREAEKRIVILHEEFVRSGKWWGRLHEVTFFVSYMLRSMDLFSNIPTGIKLFLKGKLPIIPRRIKGIGEIQRLYAEAGKPVSRDGE